MKGQRSLIVTAHDLIKMRKLISLKGFQGETKQVMTFHESFVNLSCINLKGEKFSFNFPTCPTDIYGETMK